MKLTRLLLGCGMILSAWSLATANDLYVAQNTSGSDAGTNCANAHSLAWLNANWSQVNPGDTVHLCGTFTNALTISKNGAPGSPITIHFEAGANFTSPAWPTTGAINEVRALSWIIVDGGANGLIQNSNNGTTLGLQQASYMVYLSPCTNVTIENLTITNVYVRTASSTTDANNFGSGVFVSGTGITISNCTVIDSADLIDVVYPPGVNSNIVVVGNTLLRSNHALTVGTGAAGSFLNNLTIGNNRIDGLDVWEGQAGFHRDGIFLFVETGGGVGGISNALIYGNNIGPGINPQTTVAGTAAIFMDDYNSTQFQHFRIYNNLLTLKPPLSWANGFIVGGYVRDLLVANNTMVGWSSNGTYYGGAAWVGGTNSFAYNNILLAGSGEGFSGDPINTTNTTTDTNLPDFLSIWSDYNIFATAKLFALFAPHTDGSSWEPVMNSLSSWQTQFTNYTFSALHCDPHSTTNLPALSAGYAPLTGDIVAIGRGTNLSAYFSTDLSGNPRPATGPWTIGAFEPVHPKRWRVFEAQ